MDGQKQPEEPVVDGEDKATSSKQLHHSFMDVRRPKPMADTPAAAADEPKTAAPAEATPNPSNDSAEVADDPAQKLEEPKKEKQPKVSKPPKPPRQPGVGLAIFATVVIVFGLAALATYAYLRTNNVAPF